MRQARGDSEAGSVDRLTRPASGLVRLAAFRIGGQLDTLGRDLDHLPIAPDYEGHAQLSVSANHPAAATIARSIAVPSRMMLAISRNGRRLTESRRSACGCPATSPSSSTTGVPSLAPCAMSERPPRTLPSYRRRVLATGPTRAVAEGWSGKVARGRSQWRRGRPGGGEVGRAYRRLWASRDLGVDGIDTR